jgi:hypothetical protein
MIMNNTNVFIEKNGENAVNKKMNSKLLKFSRANIKIQRGACSGR